jgi:hypothetical protein
MNDVYVRALSMARCSRAASKAFRAAAVPWDRRPAARGWCEVPARFKASETQAVPATAIAASATIRRLRMRRPRAIDRRWVRQRSRRETKGV